MISSREERLRVKQARQSIDRKLSGHHMTSTRHNWEDDARSSEMERIRKQQLRLENEKRYNKDHSYLTKERQLAKPEDKALSKSKPDITNVKSKLFDFEKSSPRSRRQLMESNNRDTPSTSNVGKATHAINVNKFSQNVLTNLSVKPHDGKQSSRHKLGPDTNSVVLPHTALEKEASKRGGKETVSVTLETQRSSTRLSVNESHQPQSSPRRKSDVTSGMGQRLSVSPDYARRHSDVPRINVQSEEESEDSRKLKELYDKAIETVTQCDDEMLVGKSSEGSSGLKSHRSSDIRQKSGLDIYSLKELETILNDARLYSSRKSSKDDHSRLDLGSNRAQKKRIAHLEEVLKQLNPNHNVSTVELDPNDILQCSYLRLSKSNVESLEKMIREKGQDPGIHIHSDVTNYDIWAGIENERADLQQKRSLPNPTTGSKKSCHA